MMGENFESSFASFLKEKLAERGNTDIEITNVRYQGQCAVLADVSYTWYLHSWDKRAEHKDVIGVFRDGQWHTPLVW